MTRGNHFLGLGSTVVGGCFGLLLINASAMVGIRTRVPVVPAAMLLTLAGAGCAALSPERLAGAEPGLGDAEVPRAELRALVKQSAEAIPPLETEPAGPWQLPALIDLAERRNPATRVAWHQARSAAAAVGIAESQYYPMLALAASYGGGFWDLDTGVRADLATLAARNDALGALLQGADSQQSLDLELSAPFTVGAASVSMRWLLFDFGAREATVDVTRRNLDVARLLFDATHQTVAFAVVESFAAWQAAHDHVGAAQVAQAAADVVHDAAEARFELGSLTEPDLLQARSSAAAASYALETARAAEEIAYVTMAEALGLAPGTKLELERLPVEALPQALDGSLEVWVDRAFAERPDLLAKAALVAGRDAESRRASAARLPRIGATGQVGWNRVDNSIRGVPGLTELDFGLQTYAGFVGIEWSVFDGFAGANTEHLAVVQRQAAADELAQARNRVAAEVWRGYVGVRDAIERQHAADAMVAAADAGFASALAGFRQGLVDMPELELARARRAEALRARADSGAALLSGLARLALGTGSMDTGFLSGVGEG